MSADLHPGSPSELKERLEAERHGEPFLVYRDGDGAQCIFALGGGGRLTVGRRPENDLALGFDPNVSGVHGAFERAGGEWTIVDDGLSRNGSYLNGERVFGHRRACATGSSPTASLRSRSSGSQRRRPARQAPPRDR